MKITDFLKAEAINVDLKAEDKEGVLRELVDILVNTGQIKQADKEEIIGILLNREALGSTGIGQGVGIPHGKSPRVKELTACFGLSRQGIDFDSLDREPVYIFFLILAPEDSAGPHLKALARIARLLKDKFFRDALRSASDEKKVFEIINEEDKRRH